MSTLSRWIYLLAAVGLHAAALWGIYFGPPPFIADEGEPGDAVDVALVEAAEVTSEPPAPEPQPPEPPEPPQPEPPPPVPPEPEPQPELPPPPPDAISEPVPAPEPPKATPAPKPKPRPQPRPAAREAAAASGTPSPAGSSGSLGQAKAGDTAHATWRNRVKPVYPAAARVAKQSGRVLVVVQVNALGKATGVSVYRSSGFVSLDQAALAAARASSYNPRRFAGIPVPDTITVPYSFRLEER